MQRIFVKIRIRSGARLPTPEAEGNGGQVAENNMFFYTYVLRSVKDSKLYIGWTNNLRNRLNEHNKGLVTATKDRRPMELVYYESCQSKTKAVAREKYFKTGFGRAFLKNRI